MTYPCVCWVRGMDRGKVLTTEALAVEESVFQATHFPIPIRKARTAQGALVDSAEDQLLKDILDSDLDHLMCLINGDAGSGKSHLIHWLYRQSVRNSKAKSFHIIEIPRRCATLGGVIEKIIEGFDKDSERIRQIRRQISQGTLKPTLNGAMIQVMDQLSNFLAPDFFKPNPLDDQLSHDEKDLAPLVSRFMRNSVAREFLLKEKGKLGHIGRRLLGNDLKIDDLRDTDWTERDFEVGPNMARHMVDTDAKEIAGQLYASEDTRAQVAGILNKAFRVATPTLVGLKYGDLSSSLLEIRRMLDAKGKQLLLFIEDLSTMQGLDAELIESLIVRPKDAGKPTVATIRSVVGVTRQDSERILQRQNILDRLSFVISLDARRSAPQGEPGAVTDADLLEMAARYLNATRLGIDKLNKWNRDRGEEDAPPANACARCPDRKTCHDAFGECDGRGLFPFTDIALTRLYEKQAATSKSEHFSPRSLVKAINTVLENAEVNLADDHFPNKMLQETFGLRLAKKEIQDALERANGHDPDKAKALNEIYSEDVQSSVLPPLVAKAFGVIAPSGSPQRPPAVIPSKKTTEPDGPKSDPFDTWLNEKKIDQGTLNKWRQRLYDALLSFRDWTADDQAWILADPLLFGQKFIHFEGQTVAHNGDIKLEISATARHAIAMKSIVSGVFENFDAVRAGGTFLSTLADDLQRQLRAMAKGKHKTHSLKSPMLLLSLKSLAQGVDLSKMTLPEKLRSILATGTGLQHAATGDAWMEMLTMREWEDCRSWLLKRMLRQKGESGRVLVLDVGLAWDALLTVGDALPDLDAIQSEAPEEVAALHRKLRSRLGPTFEVRRKALIQDSKKISDLLGKAQPRDVSSRLLSSIQNLRSRNLLMDRGGRLSSWYPRRLDDLSAQRFRDMLDRASLVGDMSPTTAQALLTTGAVDAAFLHDMAEVLEAAQRTIADSLAEVKKRLKNEDIPDTDKLAKELRNSFVELATALDALQTKG